MCVFTLKNSKCVEKKNTSNNIIYEPGESPIESVKILNRNWWPGGFPTLTGHLNAWIDVISQPSKALKWFRIAKQRWSPIAFVTSTLTHLNGSPASGGNYQDTLQRNLRSDCFFSFKNVITCLRHVATDKNDRHIHWRRLSLDVRQ